MSGLSKRVSDLELLRPHHEPISIIIRFIAPGNICPEFNHLSLHGGSAWVREFDEAAIDFENRVLLEARSKQPSANNLIFISGG